MKISGLMLFLTALVLLNGCAVGPDYNKEAVTGSMIPDLPHDWRLKPANPRDGEPKGRWWTLFHDNTLNTLEEQATAHNTDLRAALDRVDASRAQARLKGADFVPSLAFDPSYSRNQATADIPQFAKSPLFQNAPRLEPYNAFSVPIDLSYEVDLWGRVRRSFEAAKETAEASAADSQNIFLTLTGDVAMRYLTLRELDAETAILTQTERTRQSSLEINHTRLAAGRATEIDVDQAQTNLSNVRTELAAARKDRAESEHALAILCGEMPTTFAIEDKPLIGEAPTVPIGLPTTLLERRPDVARAEREMAAANAQIGVAKAAFFPVVTLTGQGGYLGASASDLFTWQNSAWALGPSVHFPLFDGGRNTATLKAAEADYDRSLENYRGVVLRAVGDVEDSLSSIQFLAEERTNLDQACASSASAAGLARQRFKVGQTNYIEVTVAEDDELAAERAQTQVRGQQFYAAIRLIKAMGGDWNGVVIPEQYAGNQY